MVWGFELHLSHSQDVEDDDKLLKMVLQSKPVPFPPSQIGALHLDPLWEVVPP